MSTRYFFTVAYTAEVTVLTCYRNTTNTAVRDIYLGMWPATQVNSAWLSLRE